MWAVIPMRAWFCPLCTAQRVGEQNGSRGIKVGKAHAVLGQLIDVGRIDKIVSVTADASPTEVIDEDEHDIGLGCIQTKGMEDKFRMPANIGCFVSCVLRFSFLFAFKYALRVRQLWDGSLGSLLPSVQFRPVAWPPDPASSWPNCSFLPGPP